MTLSETLDTPASRLERVVMFAQVADVADLKAQGETVWLNTLGWFHDIVDEGLDAGGRVVKYFDNGVLVLFEPSRAVDAVNAAILIQETLVAGSVARRVACGGRIAITSGSLVTFPAPTGAEDWIGCAIDRAVALAGIGTEKAILVEKSALSLTATGRIRSRAGETKTPPRTPEEYQGPLQQMTLAEIPMPFEFHEIVWDQGAAGPRFRLAAAPVPSSSSSATVLGSSSDEATGEERLIGTVRRWDKKKGQGFIISKEGEFFYVDRRYTAGPPELSPGSKVYFVPRPPLIEGKNRLAACVLALGQAVQGRVVRVGKKGFGFVEVGDSSGNTQRLFMFLGDNREGFSGGDTVAFTVGENDRGPVAQNASRAGVASRPRHEVIGSRER